MSGALALCFFLFQPDPAALVPLYEKALAERERELGPTHPKVARLASDFGLFHIRNGYPDAARPLLRRALEIDERHYGPTSRITAEDMEHLASVVPQEEATALRVRAAQCDDAGVAAGVVRPHAREHLAAAIGAPQADRERIEELRERERGVAG